MVLVKGLDFSGREPLSIPRSHEKPNLNALNQYSKFAFSSLQKISAVPNQLYKTVQNDCEKPWSLDDCDPKTIDDQKNIEKVNNTINFLKNLLAEKGLQPDQPDGRYEELLAVGLYYFVDTPPSTSSAVQNFILIHKQRRSERMQELKQLGLAEFQQYLLVKGGLGTSLMTEDPEHELDAVEALRQNMGYCTEKSKVLYEVYKKAELEPFFVFLKKSDYRKTFEDKGIQVNPRLHHVYLGLPFGKPSQIRYFDLTLTRSIGSDVDFVNPQHLTENEFISINLFLEASTKNPEQALPLIRQAIEKNPKNPMAFYQLGNVFSEMSGQTIHSDEKETLYQKAGESYQAALALDAGFPEFWNNYGKFLAGQGKSREAKNAFEKSLALDPKNSTTLSNLGKLLFEGQQIEKAESCFRQAWKNEDETNYPTLIALCVLDKCSLNEKRENNFHQEVFDQPKKWIQKLTKKISKFDYQDEKQKSYDHFALAFAFGVAGDLKNSLLENQKASQLYPEEPLYDSYQSFCFDKLGQKDQAEKMKEQAWEKAKAWQAKD